MGIGIFFGGQFFFGGFFGLSDGHDGWPDEQRRKQIEAEQEAAIRRFKDDRASLRSHLERALYGEPEELIAELETVAEPQVADSLYKPLLDRIDYDRLAEKIELALMVYQQAQARDEEEDMILLLNG